jgi:chorismate synthase
MLSINAVKGFELGSGFAAARMKGSAHNDAFQQKDGRTTTRTNFSGGIQGGISNGMDIVSRVAFKPVASIRQKQETIDKSGAKASLEITGRHDPCVVPRAVPIVEAMAALVLADHILRQRTDKLEI